MKNKVIRAMLLSMAATMAVPGTAVFATENTEPVAEETTVETTETADVIEDADAMLDAMLLDENINDIINDATDNATDNATNDGTNGETTDNTIDEAEDFRDKLSSLSFSEDVFGKHAAALTEFVNSPDLDVSHIYNCEMDVVRIAEVLARGESAETIRSMKYHVALVFEVVYGEDAFRAGKDIRAAILEDSNIEADFSEAVTVQDLDNIYTAAGGIVTNPIDLYKPDVTPTPSQDPENPGEEPETPTGELDTYVQGIEDIEMQVGDPIPNPNFVFDSNVVTSVTIDTSMVNPDEIGTYTIVYTINGVDGSVKTVEKQCAVVENSDLTALRTAMCAKVDELGTNKFTESEFQEKWKTLADQAKASINTMTDEDAMQKVVDALAESTQEIINEEQVFVAKKGYTKILNDYFASFTFETDTLKEMAQKALDEALVNVENAEDTDTAAKAMETGKEAIRKIGEQDESIIKELKSIALKEIETMRNSIVDTTTIVDNVYSAIEFKLDSCETAKEIDSLMNTAKLAFDDAAKVVGGNMSYIQSLMKDLKGLSADSDTTAVIDMTVALAAPEKLSDCEARVSDIYYALTSDLSGFTTYLTTMAGQEIAGTTKASAYQVYVDLTGGTPVTKELLDEKKAAKEEIEKLMNSVEIDTENKELTEKKETVFKEATEMIDKAKTMEELEANKTAAMEKVNAFVEEVKANVELETVKNNAKKAIQEVVNAQSDSTLKAAIQKMADSSVKAIDQAKTKEDVETLLTNFKNSAETTIKQYEVNAALAKAKAEAIAKLTELTANRSSTYMTDDVKGILTTAINDIKAAKTVEDVASIQEKAREDFENAYSAAMVNAYTNKLTTLLGEYSFSDDSYAAQAKDVINKQIENVKKASDEKTMEECYKLAKQQLDNLVSQQNNAVTLAQAKQDAINEMTNSIPTNLASNYQTVANDLLAQYKEKVNAATSVEEVQDLVTEFKDRLSKAGIQPVDSNNPENGNSANPNGNTSTNVPGANNATGTTNASAKGTDLTSAGDVKTGDSNIGIIIGAGATIMAALAVAGISLRKFLKKH